MRTEEKDMPTSIQAWLKFALQQIAAESYLNDIDITSATDVQVALRRGNNAPGNDATHAVLPGKTRLTTSQAQEFTQRYQIVDHHANDATGFSATVMKDRTTGEYTLSMRSSEYSSDANG